MESKVTRLKSVMSALTEMEYRGLRTTLVKTANEIYVNLGGTDNMQVSRYWCYLVIRILESIEKIKSSPNRKRFGLFEVSIEEVKPLKKQEI